MDETDHWLLSTFACRLGLSENAPDFKARRSGGIKKTPSLNSLPGGQSSMNQRKKPDLLWILVFIFGLGVVTTGYAQGILERQLDAAYQTPVDASQQPR
ncbi:hypothetical protein [Pseudomonas putida]